eukprot:CAMPEP_0179275204 /NCGR_PEP_ID=MMETSP0797-20121207/33942_1 /TAXON_ID=47934 /ORGANISM="Dinophysis acuminata, Strain DAEP01" /LENGTH=160 /DNA_ID=CAMNT_0020983723 /DNA_START=113 /DNA_END=591 /DNA_ORIENTATION=+
MTSSFFGVSRSTSSFTCKRVPVPLNVARSGLLTCGSAIVFWPSHVPTEGRCMNSARGPSSPAGGAPSPGAVEQPGSGRAAAPAGCLAAESGTLLAPSHVPTEGRCTKSPPGAPDSAGRSGPGAASASAASALAGRGGLQSHVPTEGRCMKPSTSVAAAAA